MCAGKLTDMMQRLRVFVLILVLLISSPAFANESVDDDPPTCSETSTDGTGEAPCVPVVEEESSDGDGGVEAKALSLDDGEDVIDTSKATGELDEP